jgi:hypothetical protein
MWAKNDAAYLQKIIFLVYVIGATFQPAATRWVAAGWNVPE